MHPDWVAAFMCAALLLWPGAEARAGAPEQASAPSEAADEQPDPERGEDIEDVDLAELLDLSLDEQLGTTESVTRSDESVLRAPATLTTLDATKLRSMGASSIPDALRYVPGLTVTRSSAGDYIVAPRGAAGVLGNNIVVLLDGVPQNNPLDNSVDWDMLGVDLRDVERIEVVRGPVSTIYGSDAYQGVISISTRETAQARHSGSARAFGGVDLHPAPTAGGSASYMFSGERVTLKWSGVGRYDDAQNRRGDLHHPAGVSIGSAALLRVETSEDSELQLSLNGAWGQRGDMDHLVLESAPSRRLSITPAIRWRAFNLPSVLDSVEVWSRSRLRFVRANPEDYEGFSYTDTNSVRTEAGLDFSFDFHEILDGRLGVQGTFDQMRAPYLDPALSGVTRAGVGVHGGLAFHFYEHYEVRFHGRGELLPSLGLFPGSLRGAFIYHADRWAIRLTHSSAFRSASYVVTAARFEDPDTGLLLLEGESIWEQPSRSQNIELGATIAPINVLSIRPTLHVSSLSHMVVADFDSPVVKTFTRVPRGSIFVGAELELDWQINDALALNTGAAYLRYVQPAAGDKPLIGVPEESPVWTANLRLFGNSRDERFGYGLGGVLTSPRRIDKSLGVLVEQVNIDTPYTGYVDARFEAQPSLAVPLWLSLSGQAGLVPGVAEAPLPLAAQMGAVFMLGLEWRRE